MADNKYLKFSIYVPDGDADVISFLQSQSNCSASVRYILSAVLARLKESGMAGTDITSNGALETIGLAVSSR